MVSRLYWLKNTCTLNFVQLMRHFGHLLMTSPDRPATLPSWLPSIPWHGFLVILIDIYVGSSHVITCNASMSSLDHPYLCFISRIFIGNQFLVMDTGSVGKYIFSVTRYCHPVQCHQLSLPPKLVGVSGAGPTPFCLLVCGPRGSHWDSTDIPLALAVCPPLDRPSHIS